MNSKVFESIYGTAKKDGHVYEIHQFVQWYGYLPYFTPQFQREEVSPAWNDWYLVRHSAPCYHHAGTPRWRDPRIEEIRKASSEEPAIFYKRDEGIGYIVYKDGVPMQDIPTVGHFNLPGVDNKDIKYVNTFNDYYRGTFKRTFEDPIKIWDTEEYEKLFTPKFNIGDKVFVVTYYDYETRCGERYQVEHMTIEDVNIDMGRIVYSNNTDDFFSIDHISAVQDRCAATVEELVERFNRRNETLYMWKPGPGLGIVPCYSTKQYRDAWMKD